MNITPGIIDTGRYWDMCRMRSRGVFGSDVTWVFVMFCFVGLKLSGETYWRSRPSSFVGWPILAFTRSCHAILSYMQPLLSLLLLPLSLYFFLVPTFKYSFLSSKFHSSFDLLLKASFLSFFFCCFFPPPTTHLFFVRKTEREAGRYVDFPLSFH